MSYFEKNIYSFNAFSSICKLVLAKEEVSQEFNVLPWIYNLLLP